MNVPAFPDLYDVVLMPLTSYGLAGYAAIILYKSVKDKYRSHALFLWMCFPAVAIIFLFLFRNIGMALGGIMSKSHSFAEIADAVGGAMMATVFSSLFIFPGVTLLATISITIFLIRVIFDRRDSRSPCASRSSRVIAKGLLVISLYLSTPIYHTVIEGDLKKFDREHSAVSGNEGR